MTRRDLQDYARSSRLVRSSETAAPVTLESRVRIGALTGTPTCGCLGRTGSESSRGREPPHWAKRSACAIDEVMPAVQSGLLQPVNTSTREAKKSNYWKRRTGTTGIELLGVITDDTPRRIAVKNTILKLCVKAQAVKNALRNEEGQDLIEYALVVALIAFAAIAGMSTLATEFR